MKKLYTLLISFLILFKISSFGQLPDGSIAPNFTVYDVDSVAHTLYDYLDDNKSTLLWFFNYGSGGDDWWYWEYSAQDFYDLYGPEGEDEVMVLMIVCSGNATYNDLGSSGYTTNTPFPIIITEELNEDYDMQEWNTPAYLVCPNRETQDVTAATLAWLHVYSDECPSSTPEIDNDVNLWSINDFSNIYCSGTVIPSITIRNEGYETLISMNINLTIDDFYSETVSWTGYVETYYFEYVDLPEITDIPEGDHTLIVTLSNPNGTADTVANNEKTRDFTTYLNTQEVVVVVKFDDYAPETSWSITQDDTEYFSSDTYHPNLAQQTLERLVCLAPEQCYTFTLEDEYGDGMEAGADGYALIIYRNDTLINFPGDSLNSILSGEFCINLESGNDMLAFSFDEQTSQALIDTVNNTINIELVEGTNSSQLIANFTLSELATTYVNDVVQISGETVNDFTDVIIYTIVAENGDEQAYTVDVSVVSTGEINSESSFKIYPNPNKGTLYFNKAINGKIEIISITGATVRRVHTKQALNNLNICNLNNGLYFIRITDCENISYSRFELIK